MNQEFQAILCPFCGHTQRKLDRCEVCGGSFDPVSRRGVAVNLGPWQLHDERVPFRPGFHYTAMKRLIAAGKVTGDTIIKGPTTQQLWAPARLTPGIAHLTGHCHRCEADVSPDDPRCPQCDQQFRAVPAYNELGLPYSTASESRAAQAELELEFARSGGKSRALKLWHHPDVPMLALCPYCGQWQKGSDQCAVCGGVFDQLSQRATIIAMGPWYVRNKRFPYLPGCSYDVIRKQIEAKRIDDSTIIRGPTTRQSWSVTRNIPGLSHLVGFCWSCAKPAKPTDPRCQSCNSPFGGVDAQNALGLPFQSEAEALAAEQKLEAQFHPMMPPVPLAPPAPLPVGAGAGGVGAGLNGMTNAAAVQSAFTGLDRASLAVIAATVVEPEGAAELDAAGSGRVAPPAESVPVATPRRRNAKRQSRPVLVAALLVLIAGAAVTGIVLVAGNRGQPSNGGNEKPKNPPITNTTGNGTDTKPKDGATTPPATVDAKEARDKAIAAWRGLRDSTRDGQIGLILDNIADLMAQADGLYTDGTLDKAGPAYVNALTQIEFLRERLKLREEATQARGAASKLIITIDPSELPEVGRMLFEQTKMRFDEAQIYFENGDFEQARDVWKSAEKGLINLPERSRGMALASAAEKKYLARLDRDMDANLMAAAGGEAWTQVAKLVSAARQALIAEEWTEAAKGFDQAAEMVPAVVRAARPLAVKFWTCQAGLVAARVWHDHTDGQMLDARHRNALRPLFVKLKVPVDDLEQATKEAVSKEDLHKLIINAPAATIKTSHGEDASHAFALGTQLTTLSRMLKSDDGKVAPAEVLTAKLADLKASAASSGFNQSLTDLLDAFAKQLTDLTSPAKIGTARTTCDDLIDRLASADQAIAMLRK